MDDQVLVNYLKRSKVFRVPSSVKEFEKEVYDKFSIDVKVPIIIQKFDDAWGQYIDVVEDTDIVPAKKYLVTTELPSLLYVEKSASDLSSEVSALSSSVSSVTNEDSFEPTFCSSPCSSIFFEKTDKPDQTRIPSEKFSESLREALLKEQHLSWFLKSEFIQTICNIPEKYPSSIKVTDMARAIITTYPYLKESIGTGYGGWRQAIRDCFKNKRRLDQSEEVLKRKKKKEPKGRPGEESKSLKNKIQGTDTAEELEHTYKTRRSEIVMKNMKVEEIVEKYPTLFTTSKFSAEFFRVTEKADLYKCIPQFISIYSKGLDSLLSQRKILPAWVTELKTLLEESGASKKLFEEYLLFTLPVHFGEEQLALTYPATSTSSEVEMLGSTSPHICVIGIDTKSPKYIVVAEKKTVMYCDSLQESMATVMAAYFIFNCQYPKHWEKTLLFMESFIFQIKTGNKLPSKVINFVQKLKTCDA